MRRGVLNAGEDSDKVAGREVDTFIYLVGLTSLLNLINLALFQTNFRNLTLKM